MSATKNSPLIYSCSGCSNVAQLANTLALRIDRAGIAEMSCIAGVGGKVASLVKTAKSGRQVIAVDGCKLQCAKACLNNVGVEPEIHVLLSDFGVRKRFGEDCTPEQADELEVQIVERIQNSRAQDEAV
ncbi:putative zinc-binding protein [Pseudomonas sp. OIL-1]|uniref:putative zinc-binding protein n=1 Tax=Pseudomonas sp. OIL-1 TaxID=2706126 RepID=UPI0013A71939|nr:putative zinc-binding protein [Pseudomonas sp. OIL-1]QIB52145.1 zinc-binding protein [Pseudomonas sp. OIL-1]